MGRSRILAVIGGALAASACATANIRSDDPFAKLDDLFRSDELSPMSDTARRNDELSTPIDPALASFALESFIDAFNPDGLPLLRTPLNRAEYVRWMILDGKEPPEWMELARLADDETGNQVWRVRLALSTGIMILEGRLTADHEYLLKLRGRMPGEHAVRNLVVANGTRGPDSIPLDQPGITEVGTEPITVPVGTFPARHLSDAKARIDWWASDAVPGGILSRIDAHDRSYELAAFGHDAVSRLPRSFSAVDGD